MIANLNQSVSTAFYNVRERKVAKPSTYKQRVVADRIVMFMMLLGTIAFAVISA